MNTFVKRPPNLSTQILQECGLNRPKNSVGPGNQSSVYHSNGTGSTFSGSAAGQGCTIDRKLCRQRMWKDVRPKSRLPPYWQGLGHQNTKKRKTNTPKAIAPIRYQVLCIQPRQQIICQEWLFTAQTKLKTQCDAPRNARRSPKESGLPRIGYVFASESHQQHICSLLQ